MTDELREAFCKAAWGNAQDEVGHVFFDELIAPMIEALKEIANKDGKCIYDMNSEDFMTGSAHAFTESGWIAIDTLTDFKKTLGVM